MLLTSTRSTLPLEELTPRERAVLEAIADGLDNSEIASALGLSEKTVRNHITRVFDKIQVQHRYQAIVRARDAGLGTRARPAEIGTTVPGFQRNKFVRPGPSPHDGEVSIRHPCPRERKLRPRKQVERTMPKFVIERELAGAGKLPAEELQAISQKSCGVLQSMGPQIQWVQSFVTDDKIYCVYVAPDEASVRAHAQKGGFPANSIARVRSVIDPTTAEVAA